MSDPVLVVGVLGLAAVVAGPWLVSAGKRLRATVLGASIAAASVAVVPSRYRWTEQEIQSLEWACSQLPDAVTVPEFLAKMHADDMVSETCCLLLSAKGVAK